MRKLEFSRLNRPETPGLNVHGLTKARAKAYNGKDYEALTDADIDEALAKPDPPDNGK